MKNQPVEQTPEDALKAKNKAIRAAYFAILTEIKELLKGYSTEYLRTFLEVDYSSMGFTNQHAFYSPLVHLRFEERLGGCSIYFAKNYNFKQQVGFYLDTLPMRVVFKHTSNADNKIPIEDCLNFSLFRLDDYKEAKQLLDSGFKGCNKVTVELMDKGA